MNLKNKFVHEGIKLFSLKGFFNTTVKDIITAVNTSQGAFYYYFQNKEDLFYQVLSEAQKIWHKEVFEGIDEATTPVNKIQTILNNYKKRYIKNVKNFPGGCIFTTLIVELADQRPHLAIEANKEFVGFKAMVKKLLNEGKESGELNNSLDTANLAEMLFAVMLGASVIYGMDKSSASLDQPINYLINYLETQRK